MTSMQEHTLSAFDAQLAALDADLAEMGRMAHDLTVEALDALTRSNVEKASRVIEADKPIDEMQHRIEQKAVLAIARNQPMAIDLRVIVAAMRVANDLERVGDLAKNIAKRTIAIDEPLRSQKLMTGFGQLSRLVLAQLEDVLAAYAARDGEKAAAVRERDGDVDAVHTAVFRELLTYMLEDTRNIAVCTHLLFCAKNIERIGDHATNIAETLHYVLTGEMLEDDRPKADASSERG
jgi:phosphate transport system protein